VKRDSAATRTVFSNKICKRDSCLTGISYKLCRLFFGVDKKQYELAAVPRGEVYRDFGVLTIVEKKATNKIQSTDFSSDNDSRTSSQQEQFLPINSEHTVIIGTIRMGFGHWRMSIALASAAHYLGYTPYLLDLMSFKGSVAARSIHFLEKWYNMLSRASQSWAWFNKHIWERATGISGRKLDSCLRERGLSQLFVPILSNIPKNIPIMSTHPWVGHAAVLAGMTKVVSIIPDNLPMAFWLVEGSVHTVQSPSAYMGYRTLISMETKHLQISNCLPASAIREAGHYVDFEITSNIELDCTRRLERAARQEPRRFLLTMGGAGAQVQHFADITREIKSSIENGKAALLINMGDHEGRWNALKEEFVKSSIPWTFHSNWEETKKFAAAASTNSINGIHVFLHNDFYAAVYTTNILMRICDIVITKPSELSFYPVPKLFIHRVGRHEAWGAIRGSEMGDGTIETDSIPALHRTLHTLIDEDDLLKLYCRHILINAREGVYNGAYNAVRLAEDAEDTQ
jgi:hypothetical protein